LERWLPPAKSSAVNGSPVYGPQGRHSRKPSASYRHDDGRLISNPSTRNCRRFHRCFRRCSNFLGALAIALGSAAWRSGAACNRRARVFAGCAGTSARMQPAEIMCNGIKHRSRSFAIVSRSRLWRARLFALDATAKSAAPIQGSASSKLGDWSYTLKARATRIHRGTSRAHR